MTRKIGAASPTVAPRPDRGLPPPHYPTTPATTEERLRAIEAMNQRITGYVQFMCEAGTLNGTSAEAKETAITAFHERMVVMERQLGRIHEDLQLG